MPTLWLPQGLLSGDSLLLPGNLKTHVSTHLFVLCGMSLEVVITLAFRVSISQLNKSVVMF